MIQMIDSNCDNYRINTVLISITPLFQRYVIVNLYLRGVVCWEILRGNNVEKSLFLRRNQYMFRRQKSFRHVQIGQSHEQTPNSSTMTSNPHLTYAPIAGRAELTRLIAAAGGVTITESANAANFGKPDLSETGESKKNYMSPSGIVLLQHGDLKISQSGAIEAYMASLLIAHRYTSLTSDHEDYDNTRDCANILKNAPSKSTLHMEHSTSNIEHS